jgi:hypothetical protein
MEDRKFGLVLADMYLLHMEICQLNLERSNNLLDRCIEWGSLFFGPQDNNNQDHIVQSLQSVQILHSNFHQYKASKQC